MLIFSLLDKFISYITKFYQMVANKNLKMQTIYLVFQNTNYCI
ncbi:MAG: hypothetical protein BAJALOKI3v1_380037 [Promethearchaeota archaeon]|nr:MAG: hypothetical protein BAJALOKI3v1_380037 [Candidatus Lokiarchaeota archaeon]